MTHEDKGKNQERMGRRFMKQLRSRPNRVRDEIQSLCAEAGFSREEMSELRRVHDLAKLGGNAAHRRKVRRWAHRIAAGKAQAHG